jgi:putative tryptophan/tyrosine transport system substrate-binding protein
MIGRRRVIAAIGAAVACPLVTHAQQAVPVIGYLGLTAPEVDPGPLAGFRQGLKDTDYVAGENVAVEFRWAQSQRDHYGELAEELIDRRVAVMIATGGALAALAAKRASMITPIVFNIGGDPVKLGLVASLNHPDGNLTGVTSFSATLESKQLGILRDLVPTASTVGLLFDPFTASSSDQMTSTLAAAKLAGLAAVPVPASSAGEIETAFARLAEQSAGALLIGPGPFFASNAAQIISLAERHRLPAIYTRGAFPRAGGLASYSADTRELDRQVGVYAGRILRGESPAGLPVLQPTRFELVINLKTAKTLGLAVPPTLLATADEVIE